MSSRPVPAHRTTLILATLVLLAGALLAPARVEAQATSKVYYVPMYESELADGMDVLKNGGPNLLPVVSVETVVSLVVSINGTVIRYDHAEDGYELDIDHPTQATSEVWGDNDPDNGIPPGFATDVLTAGSVITLRNIVPRTGPAPGTLLFSGGDKIGASRTLAMTRVGWDTQYPGVLAASCEVMDTGGWGTEYVAPVGVDVDFQSLFEKVFLYVMAKNDGNGGTTVTVERPGLAAQDFVLGEGGSLALANVELGTRVTSTAPVQAHLIAGDAAPEGYLELRSFTLFPVSAWSTS